LSSVASAALGAEGLRHRADAGALVALVVALAASGCGSGPHGFRPRANALCKHELGPLRKKLGPNTPAKKAFELADTWDERVTRALDEVARLRPRPRRAATWIAAGRAAVRASRAEDRTPVNPLPRYHRAERRSDAAEARANRLARGLGLRECVL
jgi:hypothetical protein